MRPWVELRGCLSNSDVEKIVLNVRNLMDRTGVVEAAGEHSATRGERQAPKPLRLRLSDAALAELPRDHRAKPALLGAPRGGAGRIQPRLGDAVASSTSARGLLTWSRLRMMSPAPCRKSSTG